SPLAPFAQADERLVAQVALRFADVERAVLPVPVDAAWEYRRRYPERLTDRLADVPSDHERRQRIVRNVDVYAERRGDRLHQGLDLDVILVGDQIRLAVADVGLHGRHERVDEVID